MKNIFSILTFLLVALSSLIGQELDPYQFSDVFSNEATSIKSQDQTGTCWSYSSASFLESELLRMGKGEHDLSEMWVVRHIYRDKAENYVRRQGNARLSEGGLAHDLMNAVKKYGIVPQEVYAGTKTPDKPYNHSQLEKNIIEKCDELVALGKKGELPFDWMEVIDDLLDDEFGVRPESFIYQERKYTPTGFLLAMGLNADDYVNITSYTHHPFFETFILEIPDNFSNGSYFNVPLEQLMLTINNSLQRGYTMVWDGDVSNRGFAAKYGMAIVPEIDWADKTEIQKQNTFKGVEREKNINQTYRQNLFDSQETTDDHLMHLTGLLKEDNGTMFYKIKNSWGEISDLKGYIYASTPYVQLNTVAVTVHKNAIPAELAKRLGIEQTPTEKQIEGGSRKPNRRTQQIMEQKKTKE